MAFAPLLVALSQQADSNRPTRHCSVPHSRTSHWLGGVCGRRHECTLEYSIVSTSPVPQPSTIPIPKWRFLVSTAAIAQFIWHGSTDYRMVGAPFRSGATTSSPHLNPIAHFRGRLDADFNGIICARD